MELVDHFAYYRRIILSALNDPKNKQSVIPALLFKATEFLQKIDQTEFTMLEKIPDIFSWKRFNVPGGRNPLYGSNLKDNQNEKSIEEYVCSIEQIPVPTDLEELQSKTENENLSETKKFGQ